MNEVIVEYDYIAKESDELTIKKGDIIKDVIKKTGGWWEGVLNNKKGMFPDNFVRSLDKDSVVLRNSKDVSRIRQCRVVFSYNQDHEDELNLKVGDIIDIIGEEEEGWWRGVLNGKQGVFPSNFVKEIPFQPNPSNRVSSVNIGNESETKPPKLPSKPTKLLCEATYPYKAQNEDELSFKEGDVITIVNKESQDPGWWQGELNGKIGFFPDNFVVLISNNDSKNNSKEERKSVTKAFAETGAIKSVSVASQRKSLEQKTEKKDTDGSTLNKTPPIPSKKPTVSIKKSPSGSGAGILSEIKKKIVDAVDGTTGSKIIQKEQSDYENAFDQVERRSLLSDVRATRVKAPGRRPPTTAAYKDDQPTISNGNAETEIQEHIGDSEVKPRLREWEKHKAPWLEEMKQNQVKRTMTCIETEEEIKQMEKEVNIFQVEQSKPVSPPNTKFKIPQESEKHIRHSISHVPKDIPVSASQSVIIPKEGASPKLSPVKLGTSKNPVSQVDILQRLEILEETVQKQQQLIEDLRNRLQIEIEMRSFLQDKLMQNVQV
ncbi:SH3 domain-containing kinase-binding protein 1-like [Diorhabda carinulata]|uniref:SH3 domain-containing kinase-binding protein 1-like n=1 Tax=Diorhabda carinulata TaxID=1163345 RepID=UPI0025A0108E|nr:SH3 domain-containing kinase-binding protein 1-like [Diorhabda carinulata]XP_057661115.1 SH3 domain-containing kinase-binding protein 1-like [Diorhabda carinulata]